MAHGLPDFYRGVDLAYQALAQLITRPKYGAAQCVTGTVTVTASDDTQLCIVSGKGMVYGGVLLFVYTSTQKNSVPLLYIDDQQLSISTFFSMNKYEINKEHSYPFYELRYDDTNFIYSVGLSHGFTFETSFKVVYGEAHGTTPAVNFRFIYALV